MQETKRWKQTRVSGNGSNIGYTRGRTLCRAYPVEDNRNASGQWLYKTSLVRNNDVLLDFMPIQSVVRNLNGLISRAVGRRCVRISIPSKKGNSKQTQECFMCACLTIPQTTYQSQDSQSRDVISLSSKNKAA